MFGKDNYLTVSKLQTSCLYHNYFKNYKLLNMITPPPPPPKKKKKKKKKNKQTVNMVKTISLCKLACNTIC